MAWAEPLVLPLGTQQSHALGMYLVLLVKHKMCIVLAVGSSQITYICRRFNNKLLL